ncbi:ubiquitin-NEDD8-like protein RUB2 [Macadamia integrifolia]|uniref:ubiquitin-NEDD8-like protein RUB2 n=1 Tax=Macadamia integrifolia TaxID=60698 RepID=UPI001C4F4D4C|nr:ubiquitin-NEDD8-like protein RUB2 [Macadamia integrifolia]
MDVFFEIPKGKRFTIEVGYFDTVLEMKEKIQKYEGFPISRQILVFNGQVMADELDTEFYEVLNRSRIQLILEPEPPTANKQPPPPATVVKLEESSSTSSSPPRKLQILVKSGKKQFPLSMDPTETVLRLREKIHEAEGLPLNRFNLSFMGVDLMEDRSLRDYAITDHAEINVVKPLSLVVTTTSASNAAIASPPSAGAAAAAASSKKLKLMVLPKGGTKIPVEVNASDNVGELKKELQKLHKQHSHPNLPTESYFFIYKQNVMDEDRSFRWHEVRQGDTIEIFIGSVTGGGT